MKARLIFVVMFVAVSCGQLIRESSTEWPVRPNQSALDNLAGSVVFGLLDVVVVYGLVWLVTTVFRRRRSLDEVFRMNVPTYFLFGGIVNLNSASASIVSAAIIALALVARSAIAGLAPEPKNEQITEPSSDTPRARSSPVP